MSKARIDNDVYARQLRFFSVFTSLALILASFWLLLALFGPQGSFSWFDAGIFIFPLFMFIDVWRRRRELRGQFIELDSDRLSFKGHQPEATVIPLGDIRDINIRLHNIEINTRQGEAHTLDIRDFQGYAIRKQVKDLFSKLQSRIPA